jgi:hypothetical protein
MILTDARFLLIVIAPCSEKDGHVLMVNANRVLRCIRNHSRKPECGHACTIMNFLITPGPVTMNIRAVTHVCNNLNFDYV